MNRTKYENLMNDVIADFISYCDSTVEHHHNEGKATLNRVISLHYHNAEGRLEGIRKAFIEIYSLEISELDLDEIFDYFDIKWDELNNKYNEIRESLF